VLRTALTVLAPGAQPVTVLGVEPGPGLRAEVRTPLPLLLEPGAPAVRLVVDLVGKGCGGAPDTPPYLVRLAGGRTGVPSADDALRRRLDAVRPYRCTTF
jgi:hypothetical protein